MVTQLGVGGDHDLRALAGLLAVREQRDPRALDAHHGLHEGRAHVGELDKVLRPDLDVGPRVEEQERRLGDGHDDGESGSVHATGALEGEEGRGQRRARRSAADERVGPPVGDGLHRLDDRGVGRAPYGPGGIRVLGDRDRRVDDLDVRRALTHLRARSEQDHAHTLDEGSTSSHLGRTPVGAVRVDRDGHHCRFLVVVVVIVIVRDVHDPATAVGAAVRAHPVRAARLVALRAGVDRGRGDLVLRAALARASVRLLLLGNGHGRRRRVAEGRTSTALGKGSEGAGRAAVHGDFTAICAVNSPSAWRQQPRRHPRLPTQPQLTFVSAGVPERSTPRGARSRPGPAPGG